MTSHDRIGSEIAGYRIDSLIGRGGMGVVYLAEDLHLGRKVALKVLAPELAQDEKFRERFVRESRLAASLEHPNIVTVFEARETDGLLYIAMRYVAGTDLKSLIAREGPLDADRAISILSQAAAALDVAHAEGLIHRDVKPANVLITPQGEFLGTDRVYLSDFGLTKRATSDSGITATGQFVGTLDYAAPEQFQGKTVDARTDVYSLGCVLYECLTGEVPYPQDNQAALVYAHLMGTPPKVTDKLPDLPVAIDRVVAKAMAKNPEDRYPSAGELVQAAAEASRVPAVSPTTPTRPVPPPPHRTSRRALAMAGAALVLAGLVIVIVLAARSSKSAGPSASSLSAGASAPPAALPDYVARVDLASGNLVSKIVAGKDPRGIAVGEGSVWVADLSSNTVSRIDPASGMVTATIKVGKGPIAVALDEGTVWVAHTLSNSISRIDPATNRVAATIPLDVRPRGMAVGEHDVWVVSEDCVVQGIDQESGRTVKELHLPGLCSESLGMAIAGGSVWIGGGDGVLRQIESKSGKVLRDIRLGRWITSIEVEGDSLWVGANGAPGTVFRIDVHSGKVLARIAAGGGSAGQPGSLAVRPLRLAADQQHVWVTDGLNGTVSSIIIVSEQASLPITVGQVPTGVAVGLGSVWVTVDVNYAGR